MQRLEVSGALRPLYGSLGVKGLLSSAKQEADKDCHLLDCYAASSGNSLPTFRELLSVPSLRVKRMGPIGCPEASVRNYHYSLCDN